MLLTSDDDSNANSSKRRRRSSLSTNLIHHHHDEISKKEQKEIANDMVSQIKQLQADNAAMGFHEQYSGYIETSKPNQKKVSFMKSKSKFKKNTYSKDKNSNNNNTILSETDQLKHKLESITTSINRIRKDLQQRNDVSSENNNNMNNNNIFIYFQNQLTEIQDQIEDAHDDIESHIDVKFIKCIEEIKTNKEKLKTIKKDQKEQEKLYQLQKEKEQQQIIEQQRAQIKILMQKQTEKIRQHFSDYKQIDYISLDNNNGNDYIYDHMDDDSDEYMATTVTGYEQYVNKPQRLLSDNAIRIISGVVVVLTGIWIVSRIFDKSNRNGNNIKYAIIKPPRITY
eukprot:97269_1